MSDDQEQELESGSSTSEESSGESSDESKTDQNFKISENYKKKKKKNLPPDIELSSDLGKTKVDNPSSELDKTKVDNPSSELDKTKVDNPSSELEKLKEEEVKPPSDQSSVDIKEESEFGDFEIDTKPLKQYKSTTIIVFIIIFTLSIFFGFVLVCGLFIHEKIIRQTNILYVFIYVGCVTGVWFCFFCMQIFTLCLFCNRQKCCKK
jgi:hypothetical protein